MLQYTISSIQVADHDEDEAPNIQGTIIGGCYCLCYCYCLHKSAVHYYSTILVTSSRGGWGGGRAQYTGDWCWLLLTDTSSPSANLSPPSYYQHSSDEEQMNTKWALGHNLKHVSCCKQCWTILWWAILLILHTLGQAQLQFKGARQTVILLSLRPTTHCIWSLTYYFDQLFKMDLFSCVASPYINDIYKMKSGSKSRSG